VEKDRKNSPVKKEMNVWELSSLGTEFGIIIVSFILLGNFIDNRFDFSPFGILISAISGFGIGIYFILYRTRDIK
jgi:F0F1-type ATP synthase assembly protein I